MAYYGAAFGMGSLAGNIYLNFLLTYVIELPAYALSLLLIDRIGRRPVFVWALSECEWLLLLVPNVGSLPLLSHGIPDGCD